VSGTVSFSISSLYNPISFKVFGPITYDLMYIVGAFTGLTQTCGNIYQPATGTLNSLNGVTFNIPSTISTTTAKAMTLMNKNPLSLSSTQFKVFTIINRSVGQVFPYCTMELIQ